MTGALLDTTSSEMGHFYGMIVVVYKGHTGVFIRGKAGLFFPNQFFGLISRTCLKFPKWGTPEKTWFTTIVEGVHIILIWRKLQNDKSATRRITRRTYSLERYLEKQN